MSSPESNTSKSKLANTAFTDLSQIEREAMTV